MFALALFAAALAAPGRPPWPDGVRRLFPFFPPPGERR
jgi:hypothetical protein